MENYKKELNNIHAPEDLILKTLARVHEEEKKVEAEKAAESTDKNSNVVSFMDKNYTGSGVDNIDNATNNTDNSTVNKTSDNSESIVSHNSYNKYRYDDYSENSTDYTENNKVTFLRKYNKVIKTFSTIVAAAVVLFIALSLGSLMHSNQSPSPSEDSTSNSSHYAEDTQASADDYSMSESAAEESANDMEESTATADDVAEEAEDADDSYSYKEKSDAKEGYYSANGLYYYPIQLPAVSSSAAAPVDKESEEHAADDNENISNSELVQASIEEYSDYIQVDLPKLLDSYEIATEDIFVAKDSNDSIYYGKCNLSIKNDKGSVILHISKDYKLAEKTSILDTVPTILNKSDVYIGYSGKGIYATFNINDVEFFIESTKDNEDLFEDVLLTLTDQID